MEAVVTRRMTQDVVQCEWVCSLACALFRVMATLFPTGHWTKASQDSEELSCEDLP